MAVQQFANIQVHFSHMHMDRRRIVPRQEVNLIHIQRHSEKLSDGSHSDKFSVKGPHGNRVQTHFRRNSCYLFLQYFSQSLLYICSTETRDGGQSFLFLLLYNLFNKANFCEKSVMCLRDLGMGPQQEFALKCVSDSFLRLSDIATLEVCVAFSVIKLTCSVWVTIFDCRNSST